MDWFPWVVSFVGGPAIGLLFLFWRTTQQKLADHEVMVESRFAQAREDRITQIAEAKAEARKYVEENRRATDMQMIVFRDEFKEHQLKILDNFVQYRAFKDFEERMIAAFVKIDAKLDKIANEQHRQ